MSFTSRRAHAATLDVGAPDASLRWRASFGPGGQLCFGSRSVVITQLGAFDGACRPSDERALAIAARVTEQAPARTLG